MEDLINNKSLLNSNSFHLICSPQRSIEILKSLNQYRPSTSNPPIIAWEPVPDLCLPENLDDCLSVLPKLNILTPNAEEAARFFSQPEPTTMEQHEEIATKFISHLTNNSPFGTGSGIVLRSGELGCFILTSFGIKKWIPAYHNKLNPQRSVIDPTGGGNTFIGGFTTGFVTSKGNWEIAGICGNIAAGIAIEQIGMPFFEKKNDDDNGIGNCDEKWNGKSVKERIKEYIEWNGLEIKPEYIFGILKL